MELEGGLKWHKDEEADSPFLYEKELFSVRVIDRFFDLFRFLFHKTYMRWYYFGHLY